MQYNVKSAASHVTGQIMCWQAVLAEKAMGIITSQEVVSMKEPLLLPVRADNVHNSTEVVQKIQRAPTCHDMNESNSKTVQ